MLLEIFVAMVTWLLQNGCIFALFLKYFKFPDIDALFGIQNGTIFEKIRELHRISFLDICIFLF